MHLLRPRCECIPQLRHTRNDGGVVEPHGGSERDGHQGPLCDRGDQGARMSAICGGYTGRYRSAANSGTSATWRRYQASGSYNTEASPFRAISPIWRCDEVGPLELIKRIAIRGAQRQQSRRDGPQPDCQRRRASWPRRRTVARTTSCSSPTVNPRPRPPIQRQAQKTSGRPESTAQGSAPSARGHRQDMT